MLRSIIWLLLLACVAPTLGLAKDSHPLTIHPTLLPETCVFSAAFKQTQTLADVPKPLISEGRLFFHCEGGLIWQQQSPLSETRVYTRDHRVFHSSASNTLTQTQGKLEKNLAKLLTGIMAGDTRYLNRYFKAVQNSDTTLELLPKGRRVAKFIARITIHKQAQGKEILWETTLGDTTLLHIHNIQYYSEYSPQQCQQLLAPSEQSCLLISPQ